MLEIFMQARRNRGAGRLQPPNNLLVFVSTFLEKMLRTARFMLIKTLDQPVVAINRLFSIQNRKLFLSFGSVSISLCLNFVDVLWISIQGPKCLNERLIDRN